jgi:MFS transporter, ACS family, hexuronate transporter
MNQPVALKHLRYRWVILALCVGCFLFTFITRFTWPPLIPVMIPVLGMKMSQAGAYMSAFYLGYIITQIPAGIMADKCGVRLILGGSLILEGLSTSALSFINSYETGFALRILSGLGAGAVYSSCSLALMEWFPTHERGKAFGVLLAAPSGGILMTNLIVPPLNQLVGWQGAFQAVGSLTIFAGLMVLCFMRSRAVSASEEKTVIEGFKVILSHQSLVYTALAGFGLLWLELGIATWANAHIKRLGYSVVDAGIVMMWYGLGGMIAPLVSGFVSDRIGQRKSLIILSYGLTIPLCIVFGNQTGQWELSVTAFVFAFCSYVANPQLTILISQFAGTKWAATANGTSNFIFQLASMIVPFVIGWSIDLTGTFSAAWWILAAGPLAGILLMLRVRESQAADEDIASLALSKIQ